MAEHEKLRGLLESFYEDKESYESNVARLRRKVSKGLIYETVSLSEFDDMIKDIEGTKASNSLLESVLDPVRKERAPFVFDKNDEMLPEVREWIIEKVTTLINEKDRSIKWHDIILCGSSTGFQYTDTADLDLHTWMNITSDEQKKIFGSKLQELGTLLDNEMNPVSLILFSDLEDPGIDDEATYKKYENMYNVTTGKWLKKSGNEHVEIPYKYIMELSEFFMSALDLSISEFERARREYFRYKDLNPEREEITEKEKNRAIDEAFNNLKAAYDKVRLGNNVIRAFGREAYNGNEFKILINYNINNDPRLSANGAIKKMIERFGYFDKIKSSISEGKKIIDDREAELEELRNINSDNEEGEE